MPGESGGGQYVSEFLPGDYQMCRYGNYLTETVSYGNARQALTFNSLGVGPYNTAGMDNTHAGGLFVWRDAFFSSSRRFTFSELNASGWVTPPSGGQGSVEIDASSTSELYRHFIMGDAQLPGIDSTTTKYVILVHGWNPSSSTDAYQDEFATLFSNIGTALASSPRGANWKVLKYRMESDTDTGPSGWQQGTSNAENGSEAAEIARLHGYHMAKLIMNKCPSVQNVHLIAHSAGSWAARSCLQYLLANHASVKCQMTLLDAYIPEVNNLVQPDSNLGVDEMNAITGFANQPRIVGLDNYYTDGDIVFGTAEQFNWGAKELVADVKTSDRAVPAWEGHSGPIQYYADSVESAGIGWLYPGGWDVGMVYGEITLVRIDIINGPFTMPESSAASLSCRATFVNGDIPYITTEAVWSDDSPYATIDASGVLTALAVPSDQSVRVTATYGGKTDELTITIQNGGGPTLTSIAVTGPATVNEKTSAQYTCTATYSDASTANVSGSAVWSENSAFASISAGNLTATEVTSDQACTVKAVYGSKTNSLAVTIKNGSGAVVGYRPSGWLFFSWPYAYDNTLKDWMFFNATDQQWVYGYAPAPVGWKLLGASGLATGWSYHAWPWAYDSDSGGWYYFNEGDTQWCLNLRSGQWAMFGRLSTTPPVTGGMVLIPAGSFQMGNSMSTSEGNSDELPVHSVYVSAFYMDKYEVTNDQMVDVLNWAYGQGKLVVTSATVKNAQGNQQELVDLDDPDCRIVWNGSQFTMKSVKSSGYPCVEVTWYGAAAYCNYRSEREGRTPCYNLTDWSCNWSAAGYRLPTEAEWEKAARGGASGRRFPWSDSDAIQHTRANSYSSSSYSYDTSATRGYHPDYDDGGYPYTSPVGAFAPNGYGLYDMAGNVWEWCWDWYSSSYYASSPGSDPRGAASGSDRVARGGSWDRYADSCRVAIRGSGTPGGSNSDFGFRAVLPPGQQGIGEL